MKADLEVLKKGKKDTKCALRNAPWDQKVASLNPENDKKVPVLTTSVCDFT